MTAAAPLSRERGSSGRSVLIITSGQLCRNPRVLKEATTLSEAGYEVVVLTIANLPRFERDDDEILKTVAFRKVAVDHVSSTPVMRTRRLVDRAVTWISRKLIRMGYETPASLGPYHALLRLARQHRADLARVDRHDGDRAAT